MKIVEEYIVTNEYNNYIKVLLLENGIYIEQQPIGGRYNYISKEYFEICKNRML